MIVAIFVALALMAAGTTYLRGEIDRLQAHIHVLEARPATVPGGEWRPSAALLSRAKARAPGR